MSRNAEEKSDSREPTLFVGNRARPTNPGQESILIETARAEARLVIARGPRKDKNFCSAQSAPPLGAVKTQT